MFYRPCVRTFVSLAIAGTSFAQGQSIDLSTWQTIQYEHFLQDDANWVLQSGNTSVLQTVNSDPSVFLSDFDAVGQEIRGIWRVETTLDDDLMGFVFGYQSRGQYYLFDWKKTSQVDTGLFAEAGMSLKVVQIPQGADPAFEDLWPSASTANVNVLLRNTIPWVEFVDYEFVLSWVAGTIEITVLEAGQVLEHWVLNDSTFTSGNFGFYNYSQGDVRYQGFTQQGVATIYCTAKTNSLGCVPALATSGFASLSDPNPFDISAAMLVNRKNGVLFFSKSGRASMPFGGGLLCLQSPLLRVPLQNTQGTSGAPDCSGTLTFDFNAWIQSAGGSSILAGDQLNAQYFYRDPQHPDGTGYGLTDGVEFVVVP